MITLRTREPDAAPADAAADPWVAPLFHGPLGYGDQACCCPARAAFAVVVAPSVALPHPPDVLLCAHHTRTSQRGLMRPGVAVYDAAGALVTGLVPVIRASADPVPSR